MQELTETDSDVYTPLRVPPAAALGERAAILLCRERGGRLLGRACGQQVWVLQGDEAGAAGGHVVDLGGGGDAAGPVGAEFVGGGGIYVVDGVWVFVDVMAAAGVGVSVCSWGRI